MSAAPLEETPTVSLRARIATLGVGETLSEAVRFSPSDALRAANFAETSERLRNRVSPAVARAKAHTGNEYTVENGSFITRAGAILFTIAVTRTA